MGYKSDPGGRFTSDTHRRVLGHLSRPDEAQAWSIPALHNRMLPDVGTDIQSHDELQQILAELETEGHAERVNVGNEESPAEVWRMTKQGLELLTGPIADEPPPGAAVQGPANIGLPVQGMAVTQLNEDSDLDIIRPGYHNPDSPPPGSEGVPSEQEAEEHTGEDQIVEEEAGR